MEEYLCISSRFLFFDGKNRYTIEYTFGLEKWFVFKDDMQTDAVYFREDKRIKFDKVNKYAAQEILSEYLQKDRKQKVK